MSASSFVTTFVVAVIAFAVVSGLGLTVPGAAFAIADGEIDSVCRTSCFLWVF